MSQRIQILPQYLAYSAIQYRGRKLHETQTFFLDYDSLDDVTIMVAPTGAGKTFAFALPVVRSKEQGRFPGLRGCVIAPTNALIEELGKDLPKMFPEIQVKALTGENLDAFGVHGPTRWQKVLEIIRSADLVLTNPDLLNFIMYSGYAGQEFPYGRTWSEVIELLDYIVFDEFHLYDEEQLANIFCLILIEKRLFPFKNTKFIFASATPNEALRSHLAQEQIPVVIKKESLSSNGRAIHGPITVEFDDASMVELVEKHSGMIRDMAKGGSRALVLYDRLVDLHRDREKIRRLFPDLSVVENSGWTTRASKKAKGGDQSDVILGTSSKIGIGLNLNADVCFLEGGGSSAKFFQCFGRVARGSEEGWVYVRDRPPEDFMARLSSGPVDYYAFCAAYEAWHGEPPKFIDRIPKFLGAFLYAIRTRTSNWALKKQLTRENLGLDGPGKQAWNIMGRLDALFGKLGSLDEESGGRYGQDVEVWKSWWSDFLETFDYFRGAKPRALVRDLENDEPLETSYSLDWVLKWKEICAIEQRGDQRVLVVSGTRQQPESVLYAISPLAPDLERGVAYLHPKELFRIKEAFRESWKKTLASWTGRRGSFPETLTEIGKLVQALLPTVTQKRVNVKDVVERR